MEQEGDKFLKPKDAAAFLGVGLTTFYNLCKLEGLTHVRLGSGTNSGIRTTRAWMTGFMDARKISQKF